MVRSILLMILMMTSVVYGQQNSTMAPLQNSTIAPSSNTTRLTSDCNICGEGNKISSTTSVVEFEYNGEMLKNNCLEWQTVVKNPNTITEQFCKEVMINYTIDKCRCTTPDGKLLSDIMKQNMTSPSGSLPGTGSGSGSTPASSPTIRSPASSPAVSPTMNSMSSPSGSSSSSSLWGNNNNNAILTLMTTMILVVSRY